ncbi:hypothetical protein HMPREF0063_12005 [Aeromicrobium marinum DSM 15272]|uniref:LPXTG-motif cell wall anchor domain protein n=1 Tax=Aeromicrobium marinum DSM 15272 TaxID=585531 RepID=E2SE69_9ACTN|nr:hypothetical protein [Aeromicrobium marinum]EFQ82796.1 hypothetical protein HMPREF0063_12005 [Aeromicrobium marinum DSM 15272]
MNRTLTRLVLAAPLATAAFAASTVAATAGPGIDPGFSIVQPGPVDPDPQPQPQGPGDIAQPQPGPVDPHPQPQPQGPGDLTAPIPGPDDPKPQGPDDLTSNPGCTTPGAACDEPEETPETPEDTPDSSTGTEIPKPTRIDAGALGADTGDDSLTWLLVGGTVVALGGGAVAGRALHRRVG